MPHVTVKLVSGRSEHQKARIAEEVAKAIMTPLGLLLTAGLKLGQPTP
jgi:phenylpyruvate tautomerase PptA (4-oxalocrotonate tautomerase family)